MSDRHYIYDVAFSFLAQDEQIASEINTLIKGRLRTFLYSERQAELAGADGEKTFNQVFGSDARIVVVLYREGWGETPWTRIEERAIRNRAFTEGYDFALFIPLDSKPTTPDWFPKTQLWYGLERWGLESAAPVIEAAAQKRGGTIHETTAVEESAILAQEIEQHRKENQFLDSVDGVRTADEEIKRLFEYTTVVSEQATNELIKIRVASNDDELVASARGMSLAFVWVSRFSNTLTDSNLLVKISKGIERLRGQYYLGERPTTLREWEYDFGLDSQGKLGWRDSHDHNTFYGSEQLAEYFLKQLMARIGEQIKR